MDEYCPVFSERPGGFEITERGIALCGFSAGAEIADIGCGKGQTVQYLRAKYGYRMVGVDIDPAYALEADNYRIITADGKKLPFADSSKDGLIFECSMSKMEPPDAVLNECARVIKPGGKLIVSDLYAREKPAQLKGRLGRLEGKKMIESRSRGFGFDLIGFIDYSDSLKDMWARLIFENGLAALCRDMGTDACELKRVKCGYYLAVYKKSTDDTIEA